MAKPISFGEIEFRTVASVNDTRRLPQQETPFRICIMGDFSGRVNRGIADNAPSPANLRPIEVDRDNIEEVMATLGVELQLSVAGNTGRPVMVRFVELDDFHPEQLFSRLEIFRTLRSARRRLKDPDAFETARKEVRSWMKTRETPVPAAPGSERAIPGPAVSKETPGSLLDEIVGQAEGKPLAAESVSAPSDWESFMQRIVGPYLVPGRDPEQDELVAAVDAAISGLMKTVLHDPDFQALESAWRALRFLVYRLETTALLKVYLLDISKAELAADLRGSDDLQKTGAYRLLVEQAAESHGGEPWAVVAGNYTFEQNREDVEILGRMAIVARLAGAPFIAGGHDQLLACASLGAAPDPDGRQRPVDPEDSRVWDVLRSMPDAAYLGLGLPRFLLRLPYGKDTEPVDCFDFEEMPDGPEHNHYLWGNPAFAFVLLLAQAFSRDGWNLRPGVIREIQDLPLHVYREKGASATKPCAEVVLTERAVEKILAMGVMPLVCFKNQDTVRLARFQSVADPPAQLKGPWK